MGPRQHDRPRWNSYQRSAYGYPDAHADSDAGIDATATPAIELPDTAAVSVMEYLKQVDYQSSWELWPGLGEKYPASEPHGALLTTYLNPVAFAALTGKSGSMPGGSIIAKENYTLEGIFDATTVMYKKAEYNPDHNDWFWAKVGADGMVLKEGRVEGCQTCHGANKSNDYVMTGEIRWYKGI